MWDEITWIYFQTSKVALVKFGNELVTPSHTVLGMQLLIHAGIIVKQKWLTTWLFVQHLVLAVNKENIKAPYNWPLVREIHQSWPVTGGFPSQRPNNTERVSTSWYRHVFKVHTQCVQGQCAHWCTCTLYSNGLWINIFADGLEGASGDFNTCILSYEWLWICLCLIEFPIPAPFHSVN